MILHEYLVSFSNLPVPLREYPICPDPWVGESVKVPFFPSGEAVIETHQLTMSLEQSVGEIKHI